jgi:hypothetical protein
LHRLGNLVAMHGLYLLQWSWEILQPKNIVAIISSNSNAILYGCKSTRQLQCPSVLMQHKVIMVIFWTYSNTFLDKCSKTHPYYNTICGIANCVTWQ